MVVEEESNRNVVVVEENNRNVVVVVEENNKNVVVVKEDKSKRNLMVVVVYSFTIHEAVLKKTSVKFECGLAGGSI